MPKITGIEPGRDVLLAGTSAEPDVRTVVVVDEDEPHCEAATEVEAAPPAYDPSAHTVIEVLAYLISCADEDEAGRVVAAESAGKGRKGILEADLPLFGYTLD